jgi:glutamate N-acetyltransferase / amino-acid N-acetyltransferase
VNNASGYMVIDGGVTAPPGFRAAGVHCGLRRARKDLALLVSDVPAAVAGVFTMNKAQAAPILVDRVQLRTGAPCSAIVVNSGNANACTGERGLNDAWTMVRTVASLLGVPEEQVMVSSTGVIGQYLPMEKVLDGIPAAVAALDSANARDAAEAIITTDTCVKEYAIRVTIGGEEITIGAMAKGSGMIAPNMATMLAFITTDLAIDQTLLTPALKHATDRSFNRISVDGDMSTNDMAMVLANGAAGNVPITSAADARFVEFRDALEHVMIVLAKMIARDGEGATKLIEVIVRGAESEEAAATAARSVANSNLVKTAIHGCDANWGRVLAALGYSGIEFNPDDVEIALNGVPVILKNYQIVLDEELAKEALSRDVVIIDITIGDGEHEVYFWTCDLTKEYVHINASYRS